MILKHIKKEGRIRIYMLTYAMLVFSFVAGVLTNTELQRLLLMLPVGAVYIYCCVHVEKEFAKKWYIQQKYKGGKKHGRRLRN